MSRGRGSNKSHVVERHGLQRPQRKALSRGRQILAIVRTDRTFGLALWRAEEVWLGRCLMCNAGVMASQRGTLLEGATLEHILPRHHGGDDSPGNLAIACRRCNNSKGVRIDSLRRDDPRRREVTLALLERRRQRWREDPLPTEPEP